MLQTLPGPVANPVPGGFMLSRQGRVSSRRFIHLGVDIGGGPGLEVRGTPCYPAAPGVVSLVCRTGGTQCYGYGNAVLVMHSADVYSWYAHLDSISVTDGQAVYPYCAGLPAGTAPTPLGTVGVTFGTPQEPNRTLAVPHLHLEIARIWPAGQRTMTTRYDVMSLLAEAGVGMLPSGVIVGGLAPDFEHHEPTYLAALEAEDSTSKSQSGEFVYGVVPRELDWPTWPLWLIAGLLVGGAAVIGLAPKLGYSIRKEEERS